MRQSRLLIDVVDGNRILQCHGYAISHSYASASSSCYYDRSAHCHSLSYESTCSSASCHSVTVPDAHDRDCKYTLANNLETFHDVDYHDCCTHEQTHFSATYFKADVEGEQKMENRRETCSCLLLFVGTMFLTRLPHLVSLFSQPHHVRRLGQPHAHRLLDRPRVHRRLGPQTSLQDDRRGDPPNLPPHLVPP